ncbi:MAG: hypothetical protein JO277_01630 [Candidatus Eremiobacteraeota bacterium]|nr:hypothetical protein [Candidatus Eremiobacteraeota bacterium]
MSAVLVLLAFLFFAAAMYLRWLPALIAVPAMAVVMALAAGVPVSALETIVVGGSASLAPVYVAVVFGALLGRVTLDTGIARSMVNLAAEYGGERPLPFALAVCAIVALLFTSLSGLGAIIMVGSIVLPILMTTGVPRTIAATLFLMSFALGFIFNIANWKFYTSYFHVTREEMIPYAVALAAVDAAAMLVYAIVAFRRERGYATWSVRAGPVEDDDDEPRVPSIALIVPVLPIALYYSPLHLDAAPAFVVSAIAGALIARPRDAVQTLVAAAIRGVEDVAPALLLFMGIGMLFVATQQPQFSAALHALVAGSWVRNPIAFVAVFGLASPLALYRGPLNPFGVGIAVFTVLLASNALPPPVLVAAIMAVVQVQNVCDPTNTANVWVANFTGVDIETITKRTLPFQTAVATAGALLCVTATPALFGVRAFAAIAQPAYAQVGGLLAAPSARGRIGVGGNGTPFGDEAASAVEAALSKAGLRAFVTRDRPGDADCSKKPYAAYVDVLSSTFALVEGIDLDVGLRLEDCGGWIVGEWHDHAVFANGPQRTDAQGLAAQGAGRVLAWASSEPVRSANLLRTGLARAPSDAPSFYYSLFKTVDGNMRLYVRGGGPAYEAGLRSGDVVNKIDGKWWWEYGTYQAQMRAYDGKPHVFEIVRNGVTSTVTLGEPYT